MCVQYIGGYHEYIGRIPWVHRGISWVHRGGGGGCSVHRRDTISTSGDIMSTSGDVQYIGGILWYMWGDTMSTSGDVHYIGGCSVHRGIPWVHRYMSTCTENPPMYWTHIIQGEKSWRKVRSWIYLPLIPYHAYGRKLTAFWDERELGNTVMLSTCPVVIAVLPNVSYRLNVQLDILLLFMILTFQRQGKYRHLFGLSEIRGRVSFLVQCLKLRVVARTSEDSLSAVFGFKWCVCFT